MTQGDYVAAVYAVVFAVVLVYVAIIAAKLARLQRQTRELVELAERRSAGVEGTRDEATLRATAAPPEREAEVT